MGSQAPTAHRRASGMPLEGGHPESAPGAGQTLSEAGRPSVPQLQGMGRQAGREDRPRSRGRGSEAAASWSECQEVL